MATSKQVAGPSSRIGEEDALCTRGWGTGGRSYRREFRVERHEKLTGPRFDVASNFRCTGDRSSRDRVDYSRSGPPRARASMQRGETRGGRAEGGGDGKDGFEFLS